MSILQMSISAAILILAIVLVRSLAIYKLPKKAFLVLWCVALFRLLIPLYIPLPLDISMILDRASEAATDTTAPATVNFNIGVFPNQPRMVDINALVYMENLNTLVYEATTENVLRVHPVVVAWVIGMIVFALFFIVTHLRWRRVYKQALPVENDYVNAWLQRNKLMRNIQIRHSDRITSPMTYGILNPVILFPKTTDWQDTAGLRYVLTHELTHIKRFDVLTKWLLAAALCVHWFNPVVWVMYVLANRDIEVACDETVVWTFGETEKSAYALALVGLEERRSGFAPLTNNFAKYAIKERIEAIMKLKKRSIMNMAVAVLLVATIAVGGLFAVQAVTAESTTPNLYSDGYDTPVYNSPQQMHNFITPPLTPEQQQDLQQHSLNAMGDLCIVETENGSVIRLGGDSRTELNLPGDRVYGLDFGLNKQNTPENNAVMLVINGDYRLVGILQSSSLDNWYSVEFEFFVQAPIVMIDLIVDDVQNIEPAGLSVNIFPIEYAPLFREIERPQAEYRAGWDSPNFNDMWFAPILDNEIMALFPRTATGAIVYPEFFGGIYYNDNGGLVFNVVQNAPLSTSDELILNEVRNTDAIIQYVNFSYAYLNDLMHSIAASPVLPSNGLWAGVDVAENRVVVGLYPYSSEEISRFLSDVADSSAIFFEEIAEPFQFWTAPSELGGWSGEWSNNRDVWDVWDIAVQQGERQSPYRIATTLEEVRAIHSLQDGTIPITNVDVPEIRNQQAAGIIITEQCLYEALAVLNEAYFSYGFLIQNLTTPSVEMASVFEYLPNREREVLLTTHSIYLEARDMGLISHYSLHRTHEEANRDDDEARRLLDLYDGEFPSIESIREVALLLFGE